MTLHKTSRPSKAALCLLVSLMVLGFGTGKVSAFTTSDRDACWSAWTNAFYYVTGDGRGHIRNREGNTSPMSFWQLAEEIEMIEDATNVANQVTLVNQVCSGFTNQFGMNWSGNSFNDDLMWSSMAFSRAYLITGNTTYRTLAKNSFDVAYNRGLDPSDGGIFQTTGNTNPKCTCGNGSGACAAYLLYQTLNDATYKTKAQGIYGWCVTNVYDAATGAVMEGPGTGNYFTYDSGCFASIAYWLGETNKAFKAGDWVTNHWGVAMQSFGPGSDGGGMNGICLRGLARTGHNLSFLQAACDNAWSWRNVRGLTVTDWNSRTSDALATIYSYDACSHVAGMLSVPPGLPVTLPATAADVVGSQVIFTTTAFGGSSLTYQWQVIRLGVTNNIPGATNATLTLSNLQLTNTAAYQLAASNASGIVTSISGSLAVSSAPAAVNNVIAAFAGQTGQGYGFAFAPTWLTSTNGDLIAGQFPSTTNGNFDLEPAWGDRNVGSLTSGDPLTVTPGGSPTTMSTNYVTCGSDGTAGSTVIYTLTGGAVGCILTNLTVYGGWRDNGRDQQAYTVYYSKVSAPTAFIQLRSVTYNPSNPGNVRSATRTTLTPASGVLATNVAAIKFDFTTPACENGFCGYAEIAAFGITLPPILVTNILPVTAVDVVGSQVVLTAGFSGSNLSYQWQKVSGALTNDVIGATNITFTLLNLQLSDAASYQLLATNVYGVAYSTARALTVNSVPAPVNNVITSYAAQTGLGGSANDFYSTWTVAPGSLIAGQAPSNVGPGDFSEPLYHQCGTVAVLTDGSFGFIRSLPGNGSSPTQVACGGGAGQSVTYSLTGSVNGYTLTNIVVYGGWGDAGRDQQAYTVSYSRVSAPAAFIQLGSANYNPANPAAVHSTTRATFTPASGVLATNVAAVKFDFTTPAPENGYCGYSEISLYGMPTVAMNPPNITFQFAANSLNLSWPTDHTGWRLQVQTNDLNVGLGTNWFDVAGSTVTNQMSFPINPAAGGVFYRLLD